MTEQETTINNYKWLVKQIKIYFEVAHEIAIKFADGENNENIKRELHGRKDLSKEFLKELEKLCKIAKVEIENDYL